MKHMRHQPAARRAVPSSPRLVAQVDPRKITDCVVQGGIGDVGGASVVIPDTAQARRYGDAARTTAVIRHC